MNAAPARSMAKMEVGCILKVLKCLVLGKKDEESVMEGGVLEEADVRV